MTSDFRQVVQKPVVAWISGAEAVALWFGNQRQVERIEGGSCVSSLSSPVRLFVLISRARTCSTLVHISHR